MKTIFTIFIALLVLFPAFALADEKKLEFSSETESSLFMYEGEQAVFKVEYNGAGEEGVNVSIEREGKLYTYGETDIAGEVKLTLPDVNVSSPFNVRARKEGYEEDEFTLWVLKKPKLYLCMDQIVEEGKDFEVRVVDGEGRAVSCCRVVFGSIEGFTDSNGSIHFTAPDVSISTYFSIYAIHENYEQSDVYELWIADNRTTTVRSPLWIEEGKNFTVHATNASTITFAGEVKAGNNATFTAPEVEKTRAYQIMAYDSNGKLIGFSVIVVLNRTKERLLLYGPIEVLEEEEIELHVISLSNLDGKKGICVEFNGVRGETDSDGKVIFSAPVLNEEYEQYLAEVCNSSYSSTNWSVWVRKSEEKSIVIHGPSTVYECENVTFNITTPDGIPIFAAVSIDNQTEYTDRNGSATLSMPEVDSPEYKTIRASSPGYLSSYKFIYVKNAEKRLFIHINSSSVNEGDRFPVLIEDSNGEGISGVEVWFNFQTSYTDSSGRTYLTAPDVLLTSNYLISAEKEGYEGDSKWITVTENGLGKSFMELITPYAVTPWSDFTVKVIGKYGEGIENVTVRISYGSYRASYVTDKNGEATLKSPLLNKDSFFTITASKAGYINDLKAVLLLECNQIYDNLRIETSVSEITERGSFAIIVKDSSGNDVEGASVFVDGRPLDEQTDAQGMVMCRAPSVAVSRACFIYATKAGYNFGYTWINIVNTAELMDTPVIETVDNVYEGENFNVTIKDLYGNPLSGVNVEFNSLSKITDEYGEVSLTAPAVSKDTFFLLTVNEEGFAPAFKMIKIIDLSNAEHQGLQIVNIPRVVEGNLFEITVKDEYGYLVENAMIIFNNQIVGYTNNYGQINLLAPEVSRDRSFEIQATKSGYYGATSSIEVIDKGKDLFSQYLPTIVAVSIAIIVAIFAYFYYRQYMV